MSEHANSVKREKKRVYEFELSIGCSFYERSTCEFSGEVWSAIALVRGVRE